MSETKTPALTSWVRQFAKMASQDSVVDAFVARVDDVITLQIPEIASDPMLVQDLHSSTGSQWRSFLALLDDDHRLVLPSPASGLALSIARRGMDLAVLLKVYRVAQQAVFGFLNEIIEAAGEEAPPRDEALVFIWARAGRWMDDAVENLVETFVGERQRLHDGAVVRRTEAIEALLGPTPPAANETSSAIGHALQQCQTAYVLWTAEADASTTQAMLDAATAAARSLGAPPPLTLVAGIRDLWCWAATPGAPDLAALSGLEQQLRDNHLRLAIGVPADGVAGFRSSHTEARAAQTLALEAALTPPLVRYDEVELLCLLSGQGTLTRRMVEREVGSLSGADKNLALVRETVLAYLTTLNVEATAEQLFVHKNTVRYRIAKAEELLGHPLTERSTQVELALRWVALHGNPAGD